MGYFKDWWKSLFSGSSETDELGFPVLKREDIPPMPEVKPPKPENDISEPVLSFIEVYKANPKRFKVFKVWSEVDKHFRKDLLGFELKDVVANKKFALGRKYDEYVIVRNGPSEEVLWTYIYSAIRNTSWMTKDEMELVFNTVESERKGRALSLVSKREQLQRKRPTKIYKGE